MRNTLRNFLSICFLLTIYFPSEAQTIKGTYAIKNIETGMLLRPINASKADNAAIVLYSPVNWKCLTWDFLHVEGEAYRLENLFSEKTFTPEGGRKTAGNELKQAPLKKGDPTQEWVFEADGKDIYRIRLKGTDLYITPSDKTGKTKSVVILDKKRDGNIQLWTIYEQHPTI